MITNLRRQRNNISSYKIWISGNLKKKCKTEEDEGPEQAVKADAEVPLVSIFTSDRQAYLDCRYYLGPVYVWQKQRKITQTCDEKILLPQIFLT